MNLPRNLQDSQSNVKVGSSLISLVRAGTEGNTTTQVSMNAIMDFRVDAFLRHSRLQRYAKRFAQHCGQVRFFAAIFFPATMKREPHNLRRCPC
ncbi:MAG: hypothetical protein HY343_10740 [Lentisphaerae bacterium]|nr:hypothetical protein [Lentisphaerota bacterium]